MAHFYGVLRGRGGRAVTRTGFKTTGMEATAASWAGSVTVVLYYDEKTKTDMARVSLAPWHGAGVSRELYHGPVGEIPVEVKP